MGSLTQQLYVWERQKGLLNRQGNQVSCRFACYGSESTRQDKFVYRRISFCCRATLALEIYSKKMKSQNRVKTNKRSLNLSDLATGNLTNPQANFLAFTPLYKHFHLLRLTCSGNLSAFWLIHHHRPPSQNTIQRHILRSWSCQDNCAVHPHQLNTQVKLNRHRNLDYCVHSCTALPWNLAFDRHLAGFCQYWTCRLPTPSRGSSSSDL